MTLPVVIQRTLLYITLCSIGHATHFMTLPVVIQRTLLYITLCSIGPRYRWPCYRTANTHLWGLRGAIWSPVSHSVGGFVFQGSILPWGKSQSCSWSLHTLTSPVQITSPSRHGSTSSNFVPCPGS